MAVPPDDSTMLYEAVKKFALERYNPNSTNIKAELNNFLQSETSRTDAYSKIFRQNNATSSLSSDNICTTDFMPNTRYHAMAKRLASTKKQAEARCLITIMEKIKEEARNNQKNFPINPRENLPVSIPMKDNFFQSQHLSSPDELLSLTDLRQDRLNQLYQLKPGLNFICPERDDKRETMAICAELAERYPSLHFVKEEKPEWTYDIMGKHKKGIILMGHPRGVKANELAVYARVKGEYESEFTLVVVCRRNDSGDLFHHCHWLNGKAFE